MPQTLSLMPLIMGEFNTKKPRSKGRLCFFAPLCSQNALMDWMT